MKSRSAKWAKVSGFTLIEMSIVLVIIGLIVGGVLVGQDLIRAAAVRAQISQIEKYNTATNTFRGKYGYLPGDINAAAASQFGFAARGAKPGMGDGNGVLEANASGGAIYAVGAISICAEPGMFWVDLSYANGLNLNMIDGSFNPSAYAANAWWNCFSLPNVVSSSLIAQYIPEAKIGKGNYVYVWSGGYESINSTGVTGDGINYFSIGKVGGTHGGIPQTDMGLRVQEAYNIDKKVDDGLPQSGRVTVLFLSIHGWVWASNLASDSVNSNNGLSDNTTGGPVTSPSNASGDSGNSTTTCYDYITAGTLPVVYSIGGNISPNNSNQVNCALSFQFQ